MKAYRTDDCTSYRMDYQNPHLELEPIDDEINVVAGALRMLADEGVLPHTKYDNDKLLAHRKAVAELFEIPWTAITPRMQRLLYAVNAIVQPANMIAAGVFCGNTFVSNAGAAVGPGACYVADDLVGIEIDQERASLAEHNVRRIDPSRVARILADDAVEVAADYAGPIHLLYLDADGTPEQGKGVYLDILKNAYDKMPTGSVVLAHNSVNAAERLRHYLAFVRDSEHMSAGVNVVFDIEGLEVSVK